LHDRRFAGGSRIDFRFGALPGLEPSTVQTIAIDRKRPSQWYLSTSVTAIAREAGIQPGQLYGWRRQASSRVTIGFAPVQIAPGSASPELGVGGAIEIEFASGARMRIAGAMPRRWRPLSRRLPRARDDDRCSAWRARVDCDWAHRHAPRHELAGPAGAGRAQARSARR
jgi:transposase-like protein